MGRAMAELNALEPIKNRTRLIIGDALNIISPNWHAAERGDAILMSFDPVAHDTLGLQLYNQSVLPEFETSQTPTFARANPWLESGEKLGLGIHNPDGIERLEGTLE